jgi:hypothetical protein
MAIQRKPISEVIYIKNRPLFPISWLHKQEFCEYQIFLENVKGIKVRPTKVMVEGKAEHGRLFEEFKKEAVPATFEEILTRSKVVQVLSREFRVVDVRHGVYGLIDEVLLTPESFIVIDDKPGRTTYLSNIRQVHGYCLAFGETVKPLDSRPIVAALRERGTNNIYWTMPFTQSAETEIASMVDRIHALISGREEFTSSDNSNKCRGCRFNSACDRAIIKAETGKQ